MMKGGAKRLGASKAARECVGIGRRRSNGVSPVPTSCARRSNSHVQAAAIGRSLRTLGASRSSHRVQGDAVAFAVEHDRAGTVWADRMLRLEHLAAVRSDRRDGLVQPPLAIEVEQWPVL